MLVFFVISSFALFSIIPTVAQTGASQFSSDIRMTNSMFNATGTIYFGGAKMRMELIIQGLKTIVISDSQKRQSYTLMPDQHMYVVTSMDSKSSKSGSPDLKIYDPNNPCINMPDTTCRKVGAEVVDSRLCNKWLFSDKRGPKSTTWIEQRTGIPVKTETNDGTTFELINIKEGAQSASLFEIPADYKKAGMSDIMKNAMRQAQ
jgi:hypothetical protein